MISDTESGREKTMPHVVEKAAEKEEGRHRRGRPAGLEAGRVAGSRRHDAVIFEVAGNPGGQIRTTAQGPLRKEMMGIVDLRMVGWPEWQDSRARPLHRRRHLWRHPAPAGMKESKVIDDHDIDLRRIDILCFDISV